MNYIDPSGYNSYGEMNLALKIQLILTDITTLKINVYCWYIRLGEASIGGKILKEVIDESFELLLEGDVDICSVMWTGVEVVYGLAGSEKEISTLKKANNTNQSIPKYVKEIKTVNIDGMAIITGPYKKMQNAELKYAHHIYQDAAVRELDGYSKYDALTVQIQGPANKVGTPHYIATQAQRVGGSGTLGIERNIAYKSLRKSGFSVEQAKYLVREADKYFEDLGYNLYSLTRRPGNRK